MGDRVAIQEKLSIERMHEAELHSLETSISLLDGFEGPSFWCRTCSETFSEPVAHCDFCDHHYDDTECGNCHERMPRQRAVRISRPVLKQMRSRLAFLGRKIPAAPPGYRYDLSSYGRILSSTGELLGFGFRIMRQLSRERFEELYHYGWLTMIEPGDWALVTRRLKEQK